MTQRWWMDGSAPPGTATLSPLVSDIYYPWYEGCHAACDRDGACSRMSMAATESSPCASRQTGGGGGLDNASAARGQEP
ncbi:hypothetical protein EJ04DRAFT_516888 [Polyplosphaeria fusca]|uniref:Uncharacterized protein n=1 Tax=Polyplosphaeria fusca TaxID=682080 RepID=A0A9P4QKJ8_9PLEO|nr:hypothetical protein EJ04DRAFT_516888 [Polyplosphaeria fusca]